MTGERTQVSPTFLISLAVSTLLGLAGGAGFLWAEPRRAWEILTAAFLWSLIASAGTTIGRFFGERVRRGNWRRGLWLAGAQSFPLTTLFLLAASLAAGFAILPVAAPVCYVATLAIALLTGVMGVLTSPFVR
jgi:hypothetical protein